MFIATPAIRSWSRARPISPRDPSRCGIGSAAKARKRSGRRWTKSAYWSLTNLAARTAFCTSSPYGSCGQADSSRTAAADRPTAPASGPRPVHQPQPGRQLGAAAGPDAAHRARVGLAQVHQQIDIVLGPVVRVHVDPHNALILSLRWPSTSLGRTTRAVSSPGSPGRRARGSAAGRGRAPRPRRRPRCRWRRPPAPGRPRPRRPQLRQARRQCAPSPPGSR